MKTENKNSEIDFKKFNKIKFGELKYFTIFASLNHNQTTNNG